MWNDYLLDERVDGGYLLLNKNPGFYNASNVHIEKAYVHIIDDMNDAWDMYQAGELQQTLTEKGVPFQSNSATA